MKKIHSAALTVLLCGILSVSSGCGCHITYHPPSGTASEGSSAPFWWGSRPEENSTDGPEDVSEGGITENNDGVSEQGASAGPGGSVMRFLR